MPLRKARFKISDYSETRKRKKGHHERKIRMASLSLTSMVDMFAILVIFLLTNTSTVSQWVEVGHGITLPRAKAADIPTKSATVQISKEGIFVESGSLATVQEVLAQGVVIRSLHQWLLKQKKEGYVNIVAHHQVPFGVIRRVISTCQESGFANVNLVVQPKT